MASLAKITIIGNLGRDPEMRYTPNGRPVTDFSVAVNKAKKDKQTGEWIDHTLWFRITVWGDRAERMAEQLRKGSRVAVLGDFDAREYRSQNTGEKGFSLEVNSDSVIPLDRSEDAQGEADAPTRQPAAASPQPPRDDDLDDLPF